MALLSFGSTKPLGRVKAASVYVDATKIATAGEGDYTISRNGKPIIVFPGGYVADTQGAITTELNLSGVVPVDGSSGLDTLTIALLTQIVVRVKVTTTMGATFTIPAWTMRTFNAGWSSQNGTQKFKASGGGGEPFFS